ncbi:rab11 family-interacting protein 1 isoform X2 [Micropterus dolomieu]|uniref:rab11 family-interacting protein 1 isoform X2 n=1 Tax=Micropterus dolomieu TaxID=147949 RepID=UPI001E8D0E07|nr:rab11 family-interacting protein 1 isoform X2 [Micropterus dolomieu]
MSLADQQWCPTSVQVTVLQARGLRIKGKSGTNDAYAVMQVGKEKYQTSVVEKSVAPVWREEAAFDLPSLQQGGGGGTERSTLHVHVLHRALVGPDKLLGQAVINLLQLSEDKTRNKTEWFKLLDKTSKADKDRGEVLVDIQFLRNNMTASMFDLSAAGKSKSRLGKFKDKVRGKKKETDAASTGMASFSQVLTDSEEEGNGDDEVPAGKDEKKKKLKMKSLFSPKSNLQKTMSQSMSVLPAKNSSLSGSQSSGLNVDSSEGKKKFKFMIHKHIGSSDSKESSSGHQKHGAAEQSNLCINGSHVYCEEPQSRASRIGSNFSLTSSGHGSMEDVPESSPPSVHSLRAVRQYSPWTEEEEETTEVENIEEDVGELRREEEERIGMEEERRTKEEEEERVRKQDEELERFTEEKKRQEEEKRAEEERVKGEEEERIRRQEEERTQAERRRREEEERVRREEERERLAEENRRLEEQEMRRIEEEEKRLREEGERLRMEEEARMRQEEEHKLAEEKRRLEEKIRIEEEKVRQEERAQEERRREEMVRRQEKELEEKRILEEQERQRKEEEIIKEKERRQEEEKARRERDEYERLVEEKRKLEEEESKKIEEEEERRRVEEEKRAKEEERVRRQEEEREKLAEQKRILEEQERRRIEDEEKRQRAERISKEEERRRKEEERIRRQEKEEVERLAEEKRRREEEERRTEERVKREEEERIRKEEEERRREEEERVRKENEEMERLAEEKRRLEEQEMKRTEEEERARREEKAERESKEEQARKLEKEKFVGEKRRENETKHKAAEMKSKVAVESPADVTSTNPFDENLISNNPFEEIHSSPAGPDSSTAKVPTVRQRLQPVKPLNPLEQQSVSVVGGEKDNKSTGILCGDQQNTKANDTGPKGPYSQLTQEELISLVLKQKKQLSERDKKISELEQYIDNLLVRVIEEQPSILMSMNSLKKSA